MAESDLRDVPPQIDVPTIVLHGEADVQSPKDVAEGLCAAIPTWRLIVLPGVGHVSWVEAPERFTAEVKHSCARFAAPRAGSLCNGRCTFRGPLQRSSGYWWSISRGAPH